MKKLKIVSVITTFALVAVFFAGCETIKQISDSIASLQKVQFKLDGVDNFRLSGINLSNKKSVSDFSLGDGAKLLSAFRNKDFMADFTLDVAAKNPNDGSGKTTQTTAILQQLDWNLYIDNKETINGVVNKNIKIPGTGQTEIIPLGISLDLYEFFGNKGYDDMLNLALAIGGKQGSASRLKLDAKPTISTDLGPITYPGRITIVDKQWSN